MIPGIASSIGGSGKGAFSVTYLGKLEYAGAGAGDINGSIDIGEADSNKEIFIVMSVTYSTVRTFLSGTVASISVTKFTTDQASTDARQLGCFVALPSQSGSQTIQINFTGALGSGVIFVYKVLNRPGSGNQHTDTDGASSAGATSLTLNSTTLSAGGIWFATGIKNNTNTASWNNGTLDDEENNFLSNRAWSAHRDPVSSGSTPSDQFSWTGSVLCSTASWAFS